MKKKIQLTLVAACVVIAAHAQKNQRTTAFAITSPEKGSSSWNEVRLVDLNTGEEVQSIYKNAQEVQLVNARTGKPIEKKEVAANNDQNARHVIVYRSSDNKQNTNNNNNNNISTNISTNVNTNINTSVYTIVRTSVGAPFKSDRPFATNSAACAYDKKNDRLFYTPMGINQLRYIDLKAGVTKIGYFEDEPFGALTGRGDVDNQITRMVFASDGNGYALTNNGEHLIMFTSKKKIDKTVITDLGGLTDDAANGNNSIHSRSGYGGDMVADESGNLYLITANRAVFKISIETKVATFLGAIQGLPRGFSTNGATVEEGTKVIVSSANATNGYFIFDIKTLQAERYSTAAEVFNASDLANGNLISEKKQKKEEPKEEVKKEEPVVIVPEENKLAPKQSAPEAAQYKMSVYPNPVSDGVVNISFSDCPAGRYNVQLMDLAGQVLVSQAVTINNKMQIQQLKLPAMVAKGTYLVKLIGEADKVVSTERIVVQ